MADDIGRISVLKGYLGQIENLAGAETVTQSVVDEEVMQLIGSHQILGLLLDFAIGVGGNEFRADGGVHDVEKNGGGVGCGGGSICG